MIEKYIQALKDLALSDELILAGADTVLGMLYECYNEKHPYDNEEIKADFNELYRQMSGMLLKEMDNIVYPVCKLCRDHEKAGFIEGIKIGIRLANELAQQMTADVYVRQRPQIYLISIPGSFFHEHL